MATKTTGAELKAFYNDDSYWQKDSGPVDDDIWHEDLVLKVNGVVQPSEFSISVDLKDEDQVIIVDGLIMSRQPEFKNRSFETFFKAWKKQQSIVYLAVTVPIEKMEAVRAAILAAGGTIS